MSKTSNRKFSYDQNKLAVTERVWPLSGHFWLNINIIILIILRSKFAFITLVVLMLGFLILKFQTKVSCCSSFLVHHSLVHYPSFSYSSTCTSFIILKYSRSQWSSLSSSFFPWPSSRSCLTTGRVLLPEWVDGIARPHLAPLAISWAQWFSSRDYIWTALIFQTVSLFVNFSSFLPHLHDKKISVVGHRRDSNVDLLSTHCGQSRLWVLAVEVLRLNNGEQHQPLLLCSILSWSSNASYWTRQSNVGRLKDRMKLICTTKYLLFKWKEKDFRMQVVLSNIFSSSKTNWKQQLVSPDDGLNHLLVDVHVLLCGAGVEEHQAGNRGQTKSSTKGSTVFHLGKKISASAFSSI